MAGGCGAGFTGFEGVVGHESVEGVVDYLGDGVDVVVEREGNVDFFLGTEDFLVLG